jgi:hypothetical protein
MHHHDHHRLLALLALLAGCGDNLTVPTDRDPAADPDPQPLECLPNLDEQIDRSELEPAIGTPVRYVVSPSGKSRTVDLAGEENEDGDLVWDFATDFADDQLLTVTAATLEGKWYAGSFDEGAFVTPFDKDGDLESVALVRKDGLVLLGIASRDQDPDEGRTLLVYQPPIVVLQFPVEVGQEFVSSGEIVNGVVQGLPYAGRDTYEVSVDAMGTIDLPQLTFEQVFRVRTRVTVEPAVGASVVRQQTSFFSECFAEVARATSADDEASPDFSEAAELRRLGF